jgi:thiamine-phosphate pyrophosphorylase
MQNRLHATQLCAITDRTRLSAAAGSEAVLLERLLDRVEAWAAGGVQFIQLREKDLPAPQIQSLAREMVEKIAGRCRVLVNVSAAESAALAVSAGADGVHLAGKPAPGAAVRARELFREVGRDAIVSVPCHGLDDIHLARKEQVDLILFSPVFEKLAAAPQGLEALRRACTAADGIPVFALGGVTSSNAQDCLTAGAAGVAGIRLFAADDWRRLLPAS